jgi:hypothetical protein
VYGGKRTRLLEVAHDFTRLLLLQRQALIAPAGNPAPAPLQPEAARSDRYQSLASSCSLRDVVLQ